MIINFLNRHSKAIAWAFYFLFYADWIYASAGRSNAGMHAYDVGIDNAKIYTAFDRPGMTFPFPIKQPAAGGSGHAAAHGFGGGPTQPEMMAFQSVNANNMVDLFSGDFSYNIPLMDVGGYPVNLAYRSGISMDQEASWVGLGWNVNPGTITRNMRGLPDDFNGKDSIRKVSSVKENRTIGVTGGGGGDAELAGFPLNVSVGANLGIFNNNYKGWGLEQGINASINAGGKSSGSLTGGLGLTEDNSTQDGLTLSPSLSVSLMQKNSDDNSSLTSSFSVGLPYNSRSGLKGLQLSIGQRKTAIDEMNQRTLGSVSGNFSSLISFASASYTPTITLPMTSRQYTFTAKVGLEEYTFHPSYYISGYVTRQGIDDADTALSLPAYGYLHYQEGASNASALLDMNREKELVYRESPAIPHIAVPAYTYDAFSITGEGTGGMFRAYRGDIGYVYDHFIRTKDMSDRASVDLGAMNLVHAGADLNVTRAFTQNSAWTDQNSLRNAIHFKSDSGLFEATYFRNPGEKSINSKKFYDAIGGDDVVTAKIWQPGSGSPIIMATNYLTLYRNKRAVADSLMTSKNSFRSERDKRTQVISYLNAQEADVLGLNKYIENYTPNVFTLTSCSLAQENEEGLAVGLLAEYYPNETFSGTPSIKQYDTIGYNWQRKPPAVVPPSPLTTFPWEKFSVRWSGRLKAPVTGRYIFNTVSDDGVRFWMNDSSLTEDWHIHGATNHYDTVNLVAGEMYQVRVDYFQHGGNTSMYLKWSYSGQTAFTTITRDYLYPPAVDSFAISNILVKEKRINSFRKANHISEIDVLNNDGRKYIYGIPVYNLRQKETTFSVNGRARGNASTGLVGYDHGTDNSTGNRQGKDWYYTSEEVPAYAHSFLLTGIVSPDYVDMTGNGISDDDHGDAVKFDYSKICGLGHAYRWRAPYQDSSTSGLSLANYNEGLRTDSRDDKASYVYGEKELWYLHTIQSKTMIATFVLEGRSDLVAIDEGGHKHADGAAKRLKEINLYSKADFLKNGTAAIPVKTVHFEYSYELCKGVNRPVNDTGKLTLKKVWFTYNGNDKGKQNPYIFNYNALNPGYNMKSYDRWGNYKDALQNPAVTGTALTNAEYPYALQDSGQAAANAAAWTLDSIGLPSGGSIKASFESDDYAYVQNKRAMNLFRLAGLGPDSVLAHSMAKTYTGSADNLYVFVTVPKAVSSKADLLQKYLAGVSKLYFKLYVRMPDDQWGSGSEYVSCYADLDQGNSYGIVNSTTLWLRISGISLAGDAAGTYSPLAKAGIQFLRLNLPSKAYPGSEIGDNLDLITAVKMIFVLAGNVKNAFTSFDKIARGNSWCAGIDLNRSYVRLDNPFYNKIGGGHRVKRITIYDKWDKMVAGQRPAVYGQEYTYKTVQEINGVNTTVSSGVATFEPGIGGEENPFRQPIEYVEKIAPLGPVALGYSEEPLGESLFPSPSIGYSKVRVRTINYKNRKSANGYEETGFYTAYDFPTYTDRTLLDGDTKKRYKPGLANFLRINAHHYLTMSQGFKIELNDMHGKMRSQAYYPETDPDHYTSYTENIYKVVDPSADEKRLSNLVSVMHPDGTIDTAAYIGKDVELMMDMREQLSITNGYNVSVNTDEFTVPFIPPVFLLPSLISLLQREEDRYRSVATMKVIQRYGILDSVIHIDKGSKVSTRDMLYDSETGDVLLTRTQNEFNDPVYNFSYPAHWAYDGMGLAYKNIDLVLQHVVIKRGKLISGSPAADSLLFSSGDEILVAGRAQTGSDGCAPVPATFPDYAKIWSVDSSIFRGGPKCIYFIDADGNPYSGNDVTLKIVRSGRRNMNSMAGSVTTLQNPMMKDGSGQYKLVLNTASQVLNSGAAEFRQFWKVEDRRRHKTTVSCVDTIAADCSGTGTSCTCTCLKNLFAYLISSHRLLTKVTDQVTVGALVASANSAGYPISVTDCPVLQANQYKYFYALTNTTYTDFYAARIGDFLVRWQLSQWANLYNFYPLTCGSDRVVRFKDTVDVAGGVDTVHKRLYMTKSLTHYYLGDDTVNSPFAAMLPAEYVDTATTKVVSAIKEIYRLKAPLILTNINTLAKFDSASAIPAGANIQNATMHLFAAPTGYHSPQYPNAHTVADSLFLISVPLNDWSYSDYSSISLGLQYTYPISSANQNLTMNVTSAVQSWLDNGNFGFDFSCSFDSNLIYSTFCSQRYSDTSKRPYIDLTYTVGGAPDSITGVLSLSYRQTCDTIIDYSCNSVVADTSFNPYIAGVLGNWRGTRNYTYYGTRAETDPAAATNIRHNGAFHDFAAFWNFQYGGLLPSYDTTKWVWNSELTTFNPKGMEVENKDPLGRYNSILYGYNLSLPIAVTQNGRYRESAFDGFEDYGFLTQVCDTSCPADRHIDFSPFAAKITGAQKHSGKSSLKLNAGDQVGLGFTLTDQDTAQASLTFSTAADVCPGIGTVLSKIQIPNTILLPVFSPFKGRKMVVSAWVKEEQSCTCSSYVYNDIKVVLSGGSTQSLTFMPVGNIIEGWQRYEGVFTIPANANAMSVNMEATGSSAVYFDDLRIHPFNANMKSFVYNPVNLRLMAEQDENNYSTFYEYDDDGTLIRVKKETEKGIQTIKETRSALLKQ